MIFLRIKYRKVLKKVAIPNIRDILAITLILEPILMYHLQQPTNPDEYANDTLGNFDFVKKGMSQRMVGFVNGMAMNIICQKRFQMFINLCGMDLRIPRCCQHCVMNCYTCLWIMELNWKPCLRLIGQHSYSV